MIVEERKNISTFEIECLFGQFSGNYELKKLCLKSEQLLYVLLITIKLWSRTGELTDLVHL